MARGGGNKKRFSIPLMLQEKFFTSELFKVIQDAVSLILLYRTMSLFRMVSSSTFITLDVQSIYIPSSIQDWYWEVKIWANGRQYSFCLWIPWTKNTRILRKSTWKHRVLHGTCIKHGRNIKTRCIGSTSKLAQKKGLKFYQTRSNGIILYNTLPACCIPKVVRMEIGEIKNEKVHESPRTPPKSSLRYDWMKELGSEVARQAEVNQPTNPTKL